MRMKLTSYNHDILRAYANAILMSPHRCPWNPFPANSPWGKRIDEHYRRDIAGRLALEQE